MNPWTVTNCWYQAWRHNVYMAHAHPEQREGWCQAAKIANAAYVMALAEEMVRGNP